MRIGRELMGSFIFLDFRHVFDLQGTRRWRSFSAHGRFSLLSAQHHFNWLYKKDPCVLSHFSHVWLFATPWTVAPRLLSPWDSPRQEYWSGFPCPPPGDIADPGIETMSLNSPPLAGRFFTASEKHLKKNIYIHTHMCVCVCVCVFVWTCITESFSCIPETNNIVNQLYFNRNK